MVKLRSVRFHSVKVGMLVALAFAARVALAQQSFQDPFKKTGFQAGDLYSSLGASHLDAVTGRLVYTIPIVSLPRNGKLPQGLSLVYNSNNGQMLDYFPGPIYGSSQQRAVTPIYISNLTSTLAHGWRLSYGSVILVSGSRITFVDMSGARHDLYHTNGCPPQGGTGACTGFIEMGPSPAEIPAGYDAAHTRVFRSADGESYKAIVNYTGATPFSANSIARIDVISTEGVHYLFDEFSVWGSASPINVRFNFSQTRIAEVKKITDADNNQIVLGYDRTNNGWNLIRIDDGIRPVTLTWDYANFTNQSVTTLKSAGLLGECPSGASVAGYTGPDMRSCLAFSHDGCSNTLLAGTQPPAPDSLASCCQQCPTLDATCMSQHPVECTNIPGGGPGDYEPNCDGSVFSGRFLNGVTVQYAGETGKTLIHTKTTELCNTVIDDHFLAVPLLPKWATWVDRVELNQPVALPEVPSPDPLSKVAYQFTALPNGLVFKVKNPLGSEEEFRWRGFEPINWDEMEESCAISGAPAETAFSGTPTPNVSVVSMVCVPDGMSINNVDGWQALICYESGGGGSPSGMGGGDTGGGGGGGGFDGSGFPINCNNGASLKVLRCEHYDLAFPRIQPPFGSAYRIPESCGPNPPYDPNYTKYTSPGADPNCICRNYVTEYVRYDAGCNRIGGSLHGSSYGVQDRLLRDGSGAEYRWRYDRKFDDTYKPLLDGNPRSYQERRYVEITNPDGTFERLYYYDNSQVACTLGSGANKQGMPLAREVYDKHRNLIMREDYEYLGAPIPGTVPHERIRGGTSQYWNLSKLHADYFRIATTTKYYKPHFKPGFLQEDSAESTRVKSSSSDDFRVLQWNNTLSASLFTDSSTTGNLSGNVAKDYANAQTASDVANVLYAHRSEQGDYIELGHFGKTRECDVRETVVGYFEPVSGRVFDNIIHNCADDPPPAYPACDQFHCIKEGYPIILPSMGGERRTTRTWWNAEKNPAINPDRLKWTIHQPVQQFMVDAGGKVFGASLSRYTYGKLEQMRGLDLPSATCTVNDSAFPHSNVYNYNPQTADPSATLGGCPARDDDRDQLDKRGYDGDGNLNRQEIALGAQAPFSGNGSGTLANPFALNFTWLSGSPVSSQFDGFPSYKNQERTVDSATGLVQSERDPNGKQTAFAYDNLMRVTTITPPDSEAVSTIAYPTMTDAELFKGDTRMNYHYDGLGRVWKTDKKMPAIGPNTDANGFVHQYTGYDYAGRKSFVGEWTTNGVFNPKTLYFECDPAKIPASVRTASGVSIPLTSIIAPPDAKPFPGTFTCFDALGRPERVIAADGATTEYRYLGVDSLVRVYKAKNTNGHPGASPDDQITKYYHDAFGRLIMVDTDCQLKSGSSVTLPIDDPNFLICDETQPGQGADAVYFYDVAGRLVFVNLIPQLPANPRAEYLKVQYTPDEANMAGSAFGLGQIRKFSYDSLGRLKSATNPENGRVDYLDYDALGNVLEVQDEKGRAVATTATKSTGPTTNGTFCSGDFNPPTISAINLTTGTVAVTCPANTPAGTICLAPTTQTLGLVWTVTTVAKICQMPLFTAVLTGPGGYSKTNNCSGDNVGCPGTSFSLLQGGVVAAGNYRLQLTVTDFGGVSSATRNYAINIPPSPPDIQFVNPAPGVTSASATFSYATANAPATGYVEATLSPSLAGFVGASLPVSGAVALDGLFGHNQSFTLTLVLRDSANNGSELDRTAWTFTVNRAGSYTLRYSYDKRGRLTGVGKLDLGAGLVTPLTKLAYDSYTALTDGASLPYFTDPGAANAPLGKKTGALSYQQNGVTLAQAVEYLGMGGRPSASRLIVDDGANRPASASQISYNTLGLPATLTYPSFAGGALTSSSVYTAGYLQGLSGNTTDNAQQRNYLTGLSYNPAGTLASFTLGNGASTAMTYDPRNRPVSITNSMPNASFPSGNYAYDGAGNICNIGSSTPEAYDPITNLPVSYRCDVNGQTFGYDRLNRLTAAHVTRTLAGGGAPFGTQDIHYDYDILGNMKRKYSPAGTLASPADLSNAFTSQLTFGSPALGQSPRAYDANAPVTYTGGTILPENAITNRINEAGFAYDRNGNLVQDKDHCYNYDELNRMTSATLKANGACASSAVANYFYDADNLRVVKQSLNANGSVSKYVTSVRGGLDALADLTTHVADGQETTRPFDQKNYIYGPGGLIASEKRFLNIVGRPIWQIYGQSTGCAVNDPAATAQNLIAYGWDAALDFGACSSSTVKTMTTEWHELNSDGTPKSCTSQETDATTNFNARYNCGLLHINPAVGTTLLHKLKYDAGYSVKVTEHVNLGLLGERDFVVSQFTISLPRNATAAQLAYNNTLAPPNGGGSSLAAPGPSGRNVEYYQKDHLGTIRVVSNEQGAVESTHDYEPFGLELPGQDPSDNTHRFTGHERDTETGLDYMKARYYGAGMGRFGAVDPVMINRFRLQNPANLNLYPYAFNNPISYFDPTGNDGEEAQKKDSFGDKFKRWWTDVKEFFHTENKIESLTCAGLCSGSSNIGNQTAGGSIGPLMQSELSKDAQFTYDKGKEVSGNMMLILGVGETVKLAEGGLSVLMRAASAPLNARGKISAAASAIEAHSARAGSVFPKLTGNAAAKNEAAALIIKNIVSDPNAVVKQTTQMLNGIETPVIEITTRTNGGVQFTVDGSRLTMLLEPAKAAP